MGVCTIGVGVFVVFGFVVLSALHTNSHRLCGKCFNLICFVSFCFVYISDGVFHSTQHSRIGILDTLEHIAYTKRDHVVPIIAAS